MPESYHVRIDKSEHAFSAAHFITIGDYCERLHGHNYHVAVEAHGPLDDDHLVVDFLLVRDALRGLVAELDHYMLLPTRHSRLRIETLGATVRAIFADRSWSFPSGDCRLLPIENTTAEKLAAYLGERLVEKLAAAGVTPTLLRVEVDECDGQIGVWQR